LVDVEASEDTVSIVAVMRRSRRTTAKPRSRPRVPLPRQTGGVHEDKKKRPWRQRKHKHKIEE
jgi:hypothetical protein